MRRPSRRLWRLAVFAVAWAAANVAGLAFLKEREHKLHVEAYGVPYEVARRFQEKAVPGGHPAALRYRLLAPERAEPGTRYPVVLFLHGAGECGSDNVRQLRGLPAALSEERRRSRFPCLLVVPQCPEGADWSFGRGNQGPRSPLDEVTLILEEVLATCPADPGRIYLVGFSMGGYGTWELAAKQPERFAAIVPVAGGGDASWAGRLAALPTCAVHGAADDIVPASESREMIEAIRRAGGTPWHVELPGVGHGSWKPALAESDEILSWLFRQAKPRAAT